MIVIVNVFWIAFRVLKISVVAFSYSVFYSFFLVFLNVNPKPMRLSPPLNVNLTLSIIRSIFR